jgi:hypothetical protein
MPFIFVEILQVGPSTGFFFLNGNCIRGRENFFTAISYKKAPGTQKVSGALEVF